MEVETKEKPYEGWYIIRYISLTSKKKTVSLCYVDDKVYIHVPHRTCAEEWDSLKVISYQPINIDGQCRLLK